MCSSKLFVVLALLAGCAKNPSSTVTAPPVADPVPMKAETSSPVTTSMRTLLAGYERVRSHLAADDLGGVADAAREIQANAKSAYADSKATDLMGIANHAGLLADAKDIKTARASFGEVSRHLITLLSNDVALNKTMHVFECPMVKGYKKWVQPTEDLQNPYMGKRMLACGGESTWK